MPLTIFSDMDGVLCDFVSGALAALDMPTTTVIRTYDMAAELQISAKHFWSAQARQPNFWLHLAPYPGSRTFIRRLITAGCDVYYATSPSSHFNCASHKMIWLDTHIDQGESRNAFVGAKKWLLAAPGRVLIDDNADNCQKWQDRGGTAILFPQTWNTAGELPSMPERYGQVLNTLARLAETPL